MICSKTQKNVLNLKDKNEIKYSPTEKATIETKTN